MSGQQFAQGGYIQSSGGQITISGATLSAGNIIVANTAAAKNSFSQLAKATKKLEWSLESFKEMDYCHNRRGGPRSKVFCEVPKTVPHDVHSGRGKTGYWFSWKDREECSGLY